jgi:hypothetical protein
VTSGFGCSFLEGPGCGFSEVLFSSQTPSENDMRLNRRLMILFERNGLEPAGHDSIAPHNGAERELKKE